MRSCSSAISSLGTQVLTVQVSTISPVARSYQPSHRPAKPMGSAIPAPDQVGLLGSPALPLPLVEAGSWHDAAPAAEGRAEGRLVGHAFRPGVDHPVADRRVLGPGRNQPPADGDQLAVPTLALAHDRHALRGCYIPAWHKLMRDLRELCPEGALDQPRIGVEEVAAAHAPFWPGASDEATNRLPRPACWLAK
jgi:hypothetical protein